MSDKAVRHADLPWRSEKSTSTFYDVLSGHHSVASVWDCRGWSPKANAEFISLACNNHYKLVEALEAIKKHQETVMRGKYELSGTWQIANKALAEVKS